MQASNNLGQAADAGLVDHPLARDPERSAALLRTLHGMGVRVSIDDFGTGYASLEQLRQVAVADSLKIDRTFVAGIVDDARDRAIVIAAVQGHAIGAGFQLALAADLRVVTEDVQFVMAEPSLGLVPDLGGTAVLTELVGYSRALEICLTSRPVGAAEAVAVGLASIAVPVEQLEDTLADLLGALRAAPEASVRATKALLAGAATRTRGQQLAAERTAQVALLRGIAKSRGRPR